MRILHRQYYKLTRVVICLPFNNPNRIGCVMVSVLTSSAVDRGFEPRSDQAKDFKIGICSFSAKHAVLKRKSKDWLARNQNKVSEWSDMFTRGLLFLWASTLKIQLSVLVQNKANLIIISLKINLFSPWYSWKIAELALNNNHSLTQNITKITSSLDKGFDPPPLLTEYYLGQYPALCCYSNDCFIRLPSLDKI